MELLRRTLVCVCSLTVLALSAAQHDSVPLNCSSGSPHFKRFWDELQAVIGCEELLPSHWTTEETAHLLVYTTIVTNTLHQHQLKGCENAGPVNCSAAQVPANGGLACVSVGNKRYCKPLCNHGYDFGFLRRSRIYEECSEATQYKWTTQYVGGNKLAVCNEASVQVSGAKTAYFPEARNCLYTKAERDQTRLILDKLKSELKLQGVTGEPTQDCLVCG
ncbi:uncharacterized protein LOC143007421 [Genypterus blacodes]|uniref:uncharacterized protein LOC143007421 n=1 Tax=Genypterus blacodes TaxID=154954 RepID=UPI003F76AF4F